MYIYMYIYIYIYMFICMYSCIYVVLLPLRPLAPVPSLHFPPCAPIELPDWKQALLQQSHYFPPEKIRRREANFSAPTVGRQGRRTSTQDFKLACILRLSGLKNQDILTSDECGPVSGIRVPLPARQAPCHDGQPGDMFSINQSPCK